MVLFSSKCNLFHNSNLFGSSVIHILYTGCAKSKKNNSGAKRLISPRRFTQKNLRTFIVSRRDWSSKSRQAVCSLWDISRRWRNICRYNTTLKHEWLKISPFTRLIIRNTIFYVYETSIVVDFKSVTTLGMTFTVLTLCKIRKSTFH